MQLLCVRLASTLVDREEVLLLVGKVMDEALKPESPSSEKDRSDALLFCLDSHGKMILTGVQEDLSLESAGEQSTIIMTMNTITPGAMSGYSLSIPNKVSSLVQRF